MKPQQKEDYGNTDDAGKQAQASLATPEQPSADVWADDASTEGFMHWDWRKWKRQLSPDDLLSTKIHSRDFNGSRADYINIRVRVLAITLAVITPSWIPLDFVILSPSHASAMTVMRIVAALLFLSLALWTRPLHNLAIARLRLVLLIGLLGLCHVGAQLILGGSTSEGLLIGYSFLPYLLIALQSIFPLTLLESLGMVAMVMALVAGVEGYFGVLLTLPVLAELWLMGLLAGIALWAQMAQLHKLLSLYHQATRDPLTNLFNRRAFMERFLSEYHRSNRYDRPMTVVLFDLDRFKRVNDTYGHLTGDAVLKTFSQLLTSKLRTSDLVGRYGGEEFLILLPETGVQAARELAERIRSDCENTPMHGPHDEVVNVTVSGGVAELTHDEDIPELINRVDDCLYNAKKQGRNRVVMAD